MEIPSYAPKCISTVLPYITLKSKFKQLRAKARAGRASMNCWAECQQQLVARRGAPIPPMAHMFFTQFGGFSMDALVCSPAYTQPFLLDTTLGYCPRRPDYDVLLVLRPIAKRIPRDTIPFGRDPMGNLWLLRQDESVWFFDLETNEDTYLCNSLTEFANLLKPLPKSVS